MPDRLSEIDTAETWDWDADDVEWLVAELKRLREPVVMTARRDPYLWRCSACGGDAYAVGDEGADPPERYCPHCGRPISEWRSYKSEEATP